jgi:hypothetical protein
MINLYGTSIYNNNNKNNNLQHQQQQQTAGFNQFKGKRFFCSRIEKLDRGNCCFNHIVGLPVSEKTGKTNPLFDYQKIIIDKIFYYQDKDPKNGHVWVKKATGLGITELILRFMLWLCVRDNRYRNSQMCIITGPAIDIALGLIQRMKRIFEQVNIFIENKETVLEVNGVMIKAFPSNHLSTYRGLTSPKFIFLDEGDFFKKSDIDEVRDTTERYITKSNPYIVMVSTPYKPDLLFQRIEQEPEDQCIYHRLFFNYQWGLNKMFTQQEIDIQKISPSFDREYDLKYAGKLGNVFSTLDIDRAIQLGEQYRGYQVQPDRLHFAGVDEGFGSSKTAIYIGELMEYEGDAGIIRIIHGQEYDRAVPSEVVNDMFDLHKKIGTNLKWFIDSSNAGFINECKIAFKESTRWKKAEDVSIHSAIIIPVNFRNHEYMLRKTASFLSRGMLAIPKEFDKLITSLRTAQATEWNLNKEETVNDDSLDALRCLLSSDKALFINEDKR